MKIRNPTLIRMLGLLIACVLRLWIGTLRYRYRPLGRNVDPRLLDPSTHYIYAFWHENMLLPACKYAGTEARVLISQHADGQLIAEVCRYVGMRAVRGSTTRGGADAIRKMIGMGGKAHLAITPDGPRGPRRKVQQGLVYLAARTGLPIVPIGIAFRKPWRMGSWDRFAVPKPWSMAVCVTDDPIEVPADADRETLAEFTERVESSMLRMTDIAEHWVETGRFEPEMIFSQLAVASVNGRK
jgi:lysophospholipid acyltransferase (LPLAT)-like uncharacterized protein